jgi:hypothetical protein
MKNTQRRFDELTQRTLAYYDGQAESFIENTRYIDMNEFYRPFLELLPKEAHILDAGC